MNPKSVININNIFELDEEINEYLNNNLNTIIKINFDEKSDKVFNDFILKNKISSDIYLKSNYKINIDLISENFKIYLFFINCVEKSIEKISQSKYKSLFEPEYIWNFSICDNIMFNYPFTMYDIIFFPITYIYKCFYENNVNIENNVNNSIELIKTIIHEKLHINQRNNINLWENFIKIKDNKWEKITKDNEIFKLIKNNINSNFFFIDNKLDYKYQFIINPDTDYDDFIYIYMINDKKYYGNFVFNKITKLIETKYFSIDLNNNKLKMCNNILEHEHPYEIYAYNIANEIYKL